jgi:hypothetical protein
MDCGGKAKRDTAFSTDSYCSRMSSRRESQATSAPFPAPKALSSLRSAGAVHDISRPRVWFSQYFTSPPLIISSRGRTIERSWSPRPIHPATSVIHLGRMTVMPMQMETKARFAPPCEPSKLAIRGAHRGAHRRPTRFQRSETFNFQAQNRANSLYFALIRAIAGVAPPGVRDNSG